MSQAVGGRHEAMQGTCPLVASPAAMAKAIYHLKEPALQPVGSCHRVTMVAVGTWLLPVPQRGMAAALMVSDTHQVRASH